MYISFEYPYAFFLFIFLLCFFRCKREYLTIYFSHIEFLPKLNLKKSFLDIFIFSLLIIALASPFTYSSFIQDQKRGRDLVIALDASGSMDGMIGQRSKFDLALKSAQEFINKRFDDNIGIVIFGSFAYIASPITYDTKALHFILNFLDTSIAGNNTAIGEAIYEAIKAIKAQKAKQNVIILITDGHHNSGRISPKDAVEMAKKEGIKIYTIGLGDADQKLLKKIAKETEGKFFYIKTPQDFQEVFNEIDSLEPSPLRSGRYKDKNSLSPFFILLALVGLFIRIRR